MNWSTTWPPLMAKTAGMDWTAKLWATRGFSSTLTLASSTAPSVAATARSSMGPSVLHGPHQGAHRSTMTGTVMLRVSTASWKVWSVTSIDTTLPVGPGRIGRDGAASRPVTRHPTD